jgi:glycine/D-amino acid oxidase-like deaminating enzyme
VSVFTGYELTKVLGLSTAVELVERGVKVAIVGRELPEDLDSAGFASPWAVSTLHPGEMSTDR